MGKGGITNPASWGEFVGESAPMLAGGGFGARAALKVPQIAGLAPMARNVVTGAIGGAGAGAARGLGALAAQTATLALGQAAPDAELLAVHECVLEALSLNVAARANLLRFASRSTLFRKECFWISLCAECTLLP